MYILKNALTSIKRNKGRNILIGIIIIVVSIAITVTLAIRNSANTIVSAYKDANPLIASLTMNREKIMELMKGGEDNQEENIKTFNSIPSITKEEIDKFGNSEYVESYYYTHTISLDSDTLEKATDSISKEVTKTESNTTTKSSGSNTGRGGPGGGRFTEKHTTTIITKSFEIFQNSKIQTGEFSLVGYSSYDAMSNFINGTYKISDGSLFDDFDSYSCVINKELATLNELVVGDEITLKNSSNNKTYKFTITGIYEEENNNSEMTSMYSSSANRIIVSSNIVTLIIEDDKELVNSLEPAFILKSEDVINAFSEEVTNKELNEYYQVTTNLESIESETKSITNVKTFATTFLIITLIIGGVVLLVINMINVRERKYEIGVLRTIGMKKSLVMTQFVVELLIIAIISLTIGALGGSFASVPTANYLLANEISSSKENLENINRNFGRIEMNKDNNVEQEGSQSTKPMDKLMGVRSVNQVDEIDAVVNISVIIQLLGVGLLLTLISSISAVVSISRFSPLTILKERS